MNQEEEDDRAVTFIPELKLWAGHSQWSRRGWGARGPGKHGGGRTAGL